MQNTEVLKISVVGVSQVKGIIWVTLPMGIYNYLKERSPFLFDAFLTTDYSNDRPDYIQVSMTFSTWARISYELF